MYFIVAIRRDGSESFIAGFADAVEAWDVAHQLQRRTTKYGRTVRYEVR
jgi:hypothetical protein